MWNIKSSNKIIQKIQKQENHLKHLQRMRRLKSSIKNTLDVKYTFLQDKPKTKQLSHQKNRQIDLQNRLLVSKMVNYKSFARRKKKKTKNNLNSTINMKMAKWIDQNNQKFIKRLQQVSSQYSKKKLHKSVNKYDKIKASIATNQMGNFYNLPSRTNRITYLYKGKRYNSICQKY